MSDSRRDAWARIAPSFEQDRERVLKEHLSTYSVDSIPQMGVAPGRMELKGNHTDWGCGKTISLNIPFYFLAAVTPSHQNNGRVRVHSLNADSAVVEFSIASC